MIKLSSKLVRRILFGIVLLLIIFAFAASYIGYVSFRDNLESEFIRGAERTGETARVLVNGNRVASYLKTDKYDEEYERSVSGIDILCNKMDVTFIYVIIPDKDYKHITFVVSTVNEDSEYERFERGHRQETSSKEYETAYKALYDKKKTTETLLRKEEVSSTGAHITTMLPVLDDAGKVTAILCVQRQLDEVFIARNQYLRRIFLILAVLTVLVIFGQGIWLSRSLFTPILKVTKEAERFAAENKKAETPLTEEIRRDDELGRLAASIDRMEEEVDEYTKNLEEVTAKEERASTELNIASQIQESMLPNIYPAFPDRKEFSIYAEMNTAKEVGGDFYDYFLIDEDRLALLIADVSGKGVPAALFMMASKILLDNITASGDKTPAEVLAQANEAICSNNKAEMFVTVWLGILNLKTGKLIASNAGHEYPAVRKKDGDFELYKDKHGFVVGGMSGMVYKDYELQLETGDELFLYTDGVTEATNADEKLFGTDRMIRALNEVKGAQPDVILKNVTKAIDGFVGDAVQFDDITMLALDYYGEEGSGMEDTNTREITVSASSERFNDVMAFVQEDLEKAGCPAKMQMPIEVAVEEIFINIASYAYPEGSGKATVRTEIFPDGSGIAITFMDHGVPYDPLSRTDPDTSLPAEERDVGGLGVYMVKKSMDECKYDHKDGMNIFKIVKKF